MGSNNEYEQRQFWDKKYVKIIPLSGKNFKIKLEADCMKNDLLNFSDKKLLVTKVYKFNWWKRFLYKLDVPFKSMELKEIKNSDICK